MWIPPGQYAAATGARQCDPGREWMQICYSSSRNQLIRGGTMPRTSRALLTAAAFALAPLTAGAQEDAKGAPKGKPPVALPDGKAKPMVEGICATCHAIQLIPNSSGYTREHWQELVATMIDLSGNKEQQNEIIDYLATNFPPNKRRAPTPVEGNFQVTFKEWVMPQLGQR